MVVVDQILINLICEWDYTTDIAVTIQSTLLYEWPCVGVLSRSVMSHSLWPMDCIPQAPLSMGFAQQEYWSGFLFPPPWNFPDPGMEPASPAVHVDSLPLSHQGSPYEWLGVTLHCLSVPPRLIKAPGTEHITSRNKYINIKKYMGIWAASITRYPDLWTSSKSNWTLCF